VANDLEPPPFLLAMYLIHIRDKLFSPESNLTNPLSTNQPCHLTNRCEIRLSLKKELFNTIDFAPFRPAGKEVIEID